jgi:hypothetical protein
MYGRIAVGLLGLMLVAVALGCSKVEEAADKSREKANDAFEKVVIEPRDKAEEAKDKMNEALENMEKDIRRATEDASEELKDDMEDATR